MWVIMQIVRDTIAVRGTYVIIFCISLLVSRFRYERTKWCFVRIVARQKNAKLSSMANSLYSVALFMSDPDWLASAFYRLLSSKRMEGGLVL